METCLRTGEYRGDLRLPNIKVNTNQGTPIKEGHYYVYLPR